jgi:hypothetical protein
MVKHPSELETQLSPEELLSYTQEIKDSPEKTIIRETRIIISTTGKGWSTITGIPSPHTPAFKELLQGNSSIHNSSYDRLIRNWAYPNTKQDLLPPLAKYTTRKMLISRIQELEKLNTDRFTVRPTSLFPIDVAKTGSLAEEPRHSSRINELIEGKITYQQLATYKVILAGSFNLKYLETSDPKWINLSTIHHLDYTTGFKHGSRVIVKWDGHHINMQREQDYFIYLETILMALPSDSPTSVIAELFINYENNSEEEITAKIESFFEQILTLQEFYNHQITIIGPAFNLNYPGHTINEDIYNHLLKQIVKVDRICSAYSLSTLIPYLRTNHLLTNNHYYQENYEWWNQPTQPEAKYLTSENGVPLLGLMIKYQMGIKMVEMTQAKVKDLLNQWSNPNSIYLTNHAPSTRHKRKYRNRKSLQQWAVKIADHINLTTNIGIVLRKIKKESYLAANHEYIEHPTIENNDDKNLIPKSEIILKPEQTLTDNNQITAEIIPEVDNTASPSQDDTRHQESTYQEVLRQRANQELIQEKHNPPETGILSR